MSEFINFDLMSIISSIINTGLKALSSIVVFLIGLIIIKIFISFLSKKLEKSKLDISLHGFILSGINATLYLILIITALSLLGVPMTTFITILGAAGLAIGIALKDSLANLAGGILILSNRPYNVGDFIEFNGDMGTVKDIQILYTKLNTPDNKKVTIPNGALANGNIINYTAEKLRRVDLMFGISYEDDILEVKELLNNIVRAHAKTLDEPDSIIRVIEHADSSINFTVRVWVNKEDYWDVFYDLQEQVKIEFDNANISIPFPQMDVHMDKLNN